MSHSRNVEEWSAGGVVFRRVDGAAPRVLVIRDPYLNWGLPKGHVESGETPEDAAVREVREETGLDDLRIVSDLPEIDWFFRDGERLVHKYCRFFLMESRAGDAEPLRSEGITECRWLPVDDAIAAIGYDNTREVMRAAARMLAEGDTPGGG